MNRRVWRAEYSLYKGDVRIRAYRCCTKEPTRGDGTPVIVLVHGSSLAALASYDLQVPGRESYSMMEVCASLGFDVWAIDHEGYGGSSRTEGLSDMASSCDDLAVVAKQIEELTGLQSATYYGQSAGSLRAACFAQAHPGRVCRLILDAFVWTGKGSEALAKRKENLAQYLASNTRSVSRESLMGALLHRGQEALVEEGVPEILADTALREGDLVPTGTFIDMCSKLPMVEPKRVACPVLILRGESDNLATVTDLLAFFEQLPNADKHFSVLAHSGHIAHLGINRDRFYHLLRAFLQQPAVL